MSNKSFLDAMANIDDSLIEEAVQDYKKPKKKITTLSLIVCFALILGLALPIVIYRFVADPFPSTVQSSDNTYQTDTPPVTDDNTPSDENTLSHSLVFISENAIATVDHISDKSIKYTLERIKPSSNDNISFGEAIEGIDKELGYKPIINNDKFTLIVNGSATDKIPTDKGTYHITMEFDLNATAKEIVIKYYFDSQGYTLITTD